MPRPSEIPATARERAGRRRAPGLAIALVLAAAPIAAMAAEVRHDLEVRLGPDVGAFAATDRIGLAGTGETLLRLGPDFVILGLSVDGREVAVEPGRNEWRVALGGNGRHEIVVRYALGSKSRRQPAGGVLPEGILATPGGSFFPADSGWVPTVGAGPARFRVALDAPADRRALVPGRLVEEAVAEGRYRARFAFDGPRQDLVLIAGPYRITERFRDGIRLRTYFAPELAGLEDLYLTKTAGYLDLYGRRIGPYAYSAFHVVSSPLPVGLGFPYLTYVGARVLRLPFIPDTSLRHEVLHEWWGNGVYVDYETGNWAEGLTTFMADYALAEERGEAAARARRLAWLRDVAALPEARDMPLRAFVARRHGAAQVVGYRKSAMLFHMLRRELGRETFDRAIRGFWRTWRGRTAGWRDLRAAFETAAGRDLEGRFGPWLDRPGVPALRLESARAAPEAGRFRVALALGQTAPAYDLSVPVVVATAAGPVRRVLRLDRTEGRFSIVVDAKPLALTVDPDFDVLRRLAPGEAPAILRELMLAPRPALRIAARGDDARRAARELAERLLEGEPRAVADGAPPPAVPLVIVGTEPEVRAAVAAAGLPGVPEAIAGRGTARAWAGRRETLVPFAVVAARDAAALRRLLRPLAHYGARSYVVFEGARAVDKGLWPAGASPLRATFD